MKYSYIITIPEELPIAGIYAAGAVRKNGEKVELEENEGKKLVGAKRAIPAPLDEAPPQVKPPEKPAEKSEEPTGRKKRGGFNE
jgi:hypothetical protein